MHEVLLYGSIFTGTSVDFINAINEANEGDDLVVRVNSPGGDVQQGWGMIAKFSEFQGKKTVKIDGAAYSMGLFFAAYADEVEALDVSQFMVHRAAFPDWYEENYMSDSDRENLTNINKSLRSAFENKINVDAFEELKGVTMKQLFSLDERVDVFLTAKEAKKIGLINKIVNITPKKKKDINASMMQVAAHHGFKDIKGFNNVESFKDAKPTQEAADNLIVKQKTKKMTKEELKANHPGLFAEVVGIGVSEERDRVGAWLKFNDIDASAVTTGIESGENISQTAMADFQRKSFSKNELNSMSAEGANTENPKTETPEAGAELTDAQKFEAKMAEKLGVKSKK